MTAAARNRRSIIMGGSIIALILLWVFAIMPFSDRITQREESIKENAKLIRKYRMALDEAAGDEAGDDDTAKRLRELEQRLFTGKTNQLAAAGIQRIVDGAARQSDLSIRTVRVLDSEDDGSFVSIPIQVIFESDLTRLVTFISLVKENSKLLTIPELKIRVKNRRNPREITVTMEIAGYMKKDKTGT
jgi:Tfp pilus assembly protein PilO